jgi:NADH dehydrogenase (ubiquinone) 1 beta subcomplex subunit 9
VALEAQPPHRTRGRAAPTDRMAAWPGKVGQGMDASFRAAAAQYRQAAPKLTHAQRVCRLYRNALKTQNSWAVDRQVFIAEADKMRAEFDKHASLAATSVEARNLLERGEEKLFQESHPDRYIVAYLPGGSLYMRNAPLPLHVCRDGHIPEGESETFRNPDLTRVVDGEKSVGGQVLVDQHSKQMY